MEETLQTFREFIFLHHYSALTLAFVLQIRERSDKILE